MAKTQKNKATSFHLGQLKAKLAKLKRELLTPSSGGGGGPGLGFDVAKTGIASVGFIGCKHKHARYLLISADSRLCLQVPSVGKSSLMSGLTGVESVAAAYEVRYHELLCTLTASHIDADHCPYLSVHNPYNVSKFEFVKAPASSRQAT